MMTLLVISMAAVPLALLAGGRAALWTVISLAVLYDDRQLSQTVAFLGTDPSPSIFNTRIAGFQAIDWMVALLMISALCRIAGDEGTRLWMGRVLRESRIAFWLCLSTVPYAYSSIFGFFAGNDPRLLFQDLQNHAYMLGMALAAITFSGGHEDQARTLTVILAALAVKTLIMSGRLLLGIGYSWGMVFRVSLSSDSVLVLVLLFSLAFLVADRRLGPAKVFGAAVLLAAVLLILFSISSRTALLISSAQLALLLWFMTPKMRRVSLSLIALISGAAYIAVWSYKPQLLDFYWWRFTSIFEWSGLKLGHNGQLLSNSVKTLEIQNVFALLKSKGAMLFGLGQGATWSAVHHPIPLPYFNDGYPPGEWRHASTHLQLLSLALKTGLAGTALYWTGLVGIQAETVSLYFRRKTATMAMISLGLLPLMFNMANFERLYLFSGLLIGLALRSEVAGRTSAADTGTVEKTLWRPA
jgi:hypothetical protein